MSGTLTKTFPTDFVPVTPAKALILLVDNGTGNGIISVGDVIGLITANDIHAAGGARMSDLPTRLSQLTNDISVYTQSSLTFGRGLGYASSSLRTQPSTLNTVFGVAISVNADLYDKAVIVATGNATLAISGTPADGQRLDVEIFASGSARTLALPSAGFALPNGTASPLTVNAGTTSLVRLLYSARLGKWALAGVVVGLT